MYRKSFKYRIYPNRIQMQKIDATLLACRKLYNLALEQRIFVYKVLRKSVSYNDQANQLPDLKMEFLEFTLVFAQTLQDVLKRVDKAYQNFFRRIKSKDKAGFPRFRGIGRYNSFTYPQYNSLTIEGGKISISKIGKVKIKYSRDIEGTPKTLTVVKDEDQYFITISCIIDVEIPKVKIKNFIGIDLGLKDLISCSDGTVIKNPKHLKKAELKLKKQQRKLSNKKKASSNRRKQKLLLKRTHRKIKNRRQDCLHKISRSLVNKYDLLVFEDLRIKNMVKNHHLAKAIHDASWDTLLQYCSYKAEYAGKHAIQVDPKMTSKTCSHCGNIQSMPLWKRRFECEVCGLSINRDFNASKNILSKYLNTVGLTGIYAFGDSTFESRKKESSDGVRGGT